MVGERMVRVAFCSSGFKIKYSKREICRKERLGK